MKKKYTIDDWSEAFFAIDKDLETRRRYMRRFKFNPNSQILEVGCSNGVNLEALESLGYSNLVGTDISIDLLSKVKKYKCVCSDICKLGIEDSSFDEIYCRGFLHHINTAEVFSEMVRVLRPQGLIHIVEPWPTIPRKIADFLTFYILPYFSKTLYYRRVVISYEWKEYSDWLRRCKKIMSEELRRNNLKVVYRCCGLINLYMTVQKAG